jgi:HSP20 family protein
LCGNSRPDCTGAWGARGTLRGRGRPAAHLTIKGEKRQEKDEKDEQYHRMERSYGSFARSIRLHVPVDAGKVDASFKNGRLTITLPKTPAAKGTMIPVKEG